MKKTEEMIKFKGYCNTCGKKRLEMPNVGSKKKTQAKDQKDGETKSYFYLNIVALYLTRFILFLCN